MPMSEPFNFEKWMKAIESRDLEQLLSYFADDVEICAEDMEKPIRGKSNLRKLAEQALPLMAQLHLKPISVLQKGDQIAALFLATVSYDSELRLGGVRLPIAGRSARIHGAVFGTLNEAGQIVWLHRIRDTLSAIRQLGIPPEQLDWLKVQVLQPAQQQEQA